VVRCEGAELARFDPKQFYSEEQIEGYVADLVAGRRAFTEEIAAQGLRRDIRELAHRELDAMDARTRAKLEAFAPAVETAPTASEDRDPRSKWISPWEPRRPSSSFFPAPTGRNRR
jgi:phosphoenolpyruvate carboxykinase (ATP)